jgi:protocadherin-16/23
MFIYPEGNVRNHFAINATTGALSCAALDRESISEYWLMVEARDHATIVDQQRTGLCRLHIRVTDRNDNAPKFVSTDYNARVLENATIGSIILR